MPDHITVEDLMLLRSARVGDAAETAYKDGAVVRTACPAAGRGSGAMTESRKDELLRRYGLGSAAAREAIQRKLCGGGAS